MTKAMILAAGQGTRVRPLTKQLPKPMIPILGKPVLEYLIEHLARYGVRDIMINVAHYHWKIENYFGNGHRWNVNIGYSFEGAREHGEIVAKPMGSAGGMRQIQDHSGFFDDTTIVVCGDAIIDLDIQAAVFEHKTKKAMASVVALDVPREQVQNYGIVVADKEGRIKQFQEKPTADAALSTLASTGIYLFEPQVLELVPKATVFDIGSQLFPLMAEQNLPFYAQKRHFNWIDIGRVTDYWAVCQRVLRGEVAQMDMPGTEVRPGVWVGLNTKVNWDKVNVVGPVYIGSGVSVEDGATIEGPAWLGHGCVVRKNARLVRSILFDYTRLSEGAVFEDLIASPQYVVDSKGRTTYPGDEASPLRWGDARA